MNYKRRPGGLLIVLLISVVLWLVVLGIVLAIKAEAHPPDNLASFGRLAEDYWQRHDETPCEPVDLLAGHDPPQPVPNGTAAWATYGPRTCEIGLTERIHLLSGREVCGVIVHEYGHLAGLGHASDPDNVMNAVLLNPPWACGPQRWTAFHVKKVERVP